MGVKNHQLLPPLCQQTMRDLEGAFRTRLPSAEYARHVSSRDVSRRFEKRDTLSFLPFFQLQTFRDTGIPVVVRKGRQRTESTIELGVVARRASQIRHVGGPKGGVTSVA